MSWLRYIDIPSADHVVLVEMDDNSEVCDGRTGDRTEQVPD